MWRRGAHALLLAVTLTRCVSAQREQRLLTSYLSSYDSTRCSAVDTFEYASANYGSFIKTADENNTYFLVDGEIAAIQYRYRPRRELLTYESHMPQQHLGAMFTDVRDGVSYQLVGVATEPFTDNSTLLGSGVGGGAGRTFTHIRCIAVNATASAGPAMALSSPATMPTSGYNMFAGWGHAAFLDSDDMWQLIQLPDSCADAQVLVTPLGDNLENDFQPSYCEDGSTTGALEYDGFQHAVMMPCSWVDPNGDVTDRLNTVCRRTIPNGLQKPTDFGIYEVGKSCALQLDPALGRWLWLAEDVFGFQLPLFMCKANFFYPEPPPSAAPTPQPETAAPTYITNAPTMSAAPTRSPTEAPAPTVYRIVRNRRATWSSMTPILVLVFGLLFGLVVMWAVRRFVYQKCAKDTERTREAYDRNKLNYSSDAHILDISWEWHARAFMSGSKTFDEDFFITLARLDAERKERQAMVPNRFGIMGDLMDRTLDLGKAGLDLTLDLGKAGMDLTSSAMEVTGVNTIAEASGVNSVVGATGSAGSSMWTRLKQSTYTMGNLFGGKKASFMEQPLPTDGEEQEEEQVQQQEQRQAVISPQPRATSSAFDSPAPAVERASVPEIQEDLPFSAGEDGAD